MGMMFHHRRQSRDRKVIEDIIKHCENKPLYMTSYSYQLFAQTNAKNIIIIENFTEITDHEAFCFVEEFSPSAFLKLWDEIILYHWNRHYPGDLFFDINLQQTPWNQIEETIFTGYSHETIKKEIYRR